MKIEQLQQCIEELQERHLQLQLLQTHTGLIWESFSEHDFKAQFKKIELRITADAAWRLGIIGWSEEVDLVNRPTLPELIDWMNGFFNLSGNKDS